MYANLEARVLQEDQLGEQDESESVHVLDKQGHRHVAGTMRDPGTCAGRLCEGVPSRVLRVQHR